MKKRLMKKVNRDLNLQLHQHAHKLQLEQARNGSVQSNDPLEIARHLVTVLNEQGYSTKSYANTCDMHSITFYMHNGQDSPLVVENMAQNWRLEEPSHWNGKRKVHGEEGLPF
jgi:hypothetical protein